MAGKRCTQSSPSPSLPGTAQAVAAYDVHAAAARKPVDWYAVLGLLHPPHPSAVAHDDIKRQHRRLCLLVHPDKNPSAAADGAFKLVQAAWEELSARHRPADDDAATAAAPPQPGRPPPRPPDPPQQPQPQPRQPRGAHQQQGRRLSYADAARPPQPQGAAHRPATPSPPRAPRVPPPRSPSTCPSCGALMPYAKRNLRCMVCHWRRPMGRWHVGGGGDFFK
ncbi:basic salivary proline-rich protein 4-like [Setaria italica]|uniref:basic salivary proline-rich protein 4-like n=1 Tax=Setaria italica TaxID=4555 RepID=UPI000647C34A|nr:basic salivary proline-rich protein 4-like [Setaria italica]